jgi:hypothetical protein
MPTGYRIGGSLRALNISRVSGGGVARVSSTKHPRDAEQVRSLLAGVSRQRLKGSGIYTIVLSDAGSKKWARRTSKASETCWLTSK